MEEIQKNEKQSAFEKAIREYLKQGQQKLESDLAGTREAIKLIADEKTKNFMRTMDHGLDRAEREYLMALIVASMHQSFCYGYGIGKIEGKTNNKVFL
ncbi:hypothetical protein DFR58_11817 [Anaerobacterium chartisolvens]|uniref:Uncharacterized protein n=1 Tax=Anaerobacterium chartisolvens TaxID=1297424 RepID=A0A369AV00_9FIRM|nr:hypothetical protein [Anaerobacterium chartisolvens]RCX13200.1 hypothetical protein DFR58_11817 [Anaerobacterium chartisolvens]